VKDETFWSIVDANGLSGLPSDEEAALRMLVRRAADGEDERGTVLAYLKHCRINYKNGGDTNIAREIGVIEDAIERGTHLRMPTPTRVS
jgi:hypothetical protein